MFKVTGISTLNGQTKVRFANDLVSRVKILNKDGHKDINLIELPTALSKADCVKHLKTTELYTKFASAIDAADAKYNSLVPNIAKYNSLGTVKVTKPSLKAIKNLKKKDGRHENLKTVFHNFENKFCTRHVMKSTY